MTLPFAISGSQCRFCSSLPNAKIGYYTEFTLALIPPLWHYVMRRKLAIWDRDFASPAERRIAASINKAVGYDLDPRKVEGKVLEVSYV